MGPRVLINGIWYKGRHTPRVDCSTYHISGDLRSLETLCEALGIKRKSYDQSLDDAIEEAIES